MTDANHDFLPELLARLQTGDRASARRLLEEAARAHPTDPRPLLLLGADLVQAGDLDRGEAAYMAALQLAPGFAIARFQLGLLQITSGRPAAAMVTWAALEGLPETDPLRLFKRGLEALARDAFDDARRLLREGMSRNETIPALNNDMQMLLDRMADAPGEPRPGVAPPGAREETTPAQGDHFLVSSYRTRS